MNHAFSGTGASAVVEALRRWGVARVFGLPGIQTLELFDALAEAGMPTVTPCDERALVFMADASARVTGQTAVAAVTAGPGLTNALTAVAEARLDSSPVLVLVGSSRSARPRAFQLHEIPQDALLRPLVKGYFAPLRIEDLLLALHDVWELAGRGEPGPVVLELPASLLRERNRFTIPTVSVALEETAAPAGVGELVQHLSRSDSVGIYAGAGAFGAASELVELAERLQAPVATTISGRGVIPEDHPLSVGYGFGRSGTAAAWRAFRRVRTVLAVGCKYSEPATGSYGMEPPRDHLHIDVNPDSIGANYPAAVGVACDSAVALRAILSELRSERRATDPGLVALIRNARALEERRIGGEPLAHTVRPANFLRRLRRHLRRDAILAVDCGMNQFWALSDFPVYEPRTFLAPADFQAMGFAIPAALGAKLAHPGRQVVALVGDGGFLISASECLNAARWKTPIVVVVFDDGAWGAIREAQRRVYRTTPYTALPRPDYRQLAAGFGLRYIGVDSDAEIETALSKALEADEACLLQVRVDYSEAAPYVRGAGPQMFRQLPLRQKAGIVWRYLARAATRPGGAAEPPVHR